MTLDDIAADAHRASQSLAGFRDIVEAYLRASGQRQTEFGELAAGSRNFVRHMRAGRGFHVSTLRRVLDYIQFRAVVG